MVWGGLGCFGVVWGVSTDRKVVIVWTPPKSVMADNQLDVLENRLEALEKRVFGGFDKDALYPKVALMSLASDTHHFCVFCHQYTLIYEKRQNGKYKYHLFKKIEKL